jgi:tol-pal system protein YbgF
VHRVERGLLEPQPPRPLPDYRAGGALNTPGRSALSRLVVVAVAAATAGCVSSTDIETIRGQLTELQRQVSYLQLQGSSKQEVAELQATIQQQTDRLLKTEADMRVDLGNLSGQLGQLQGQLEDTNYRIAQLSQQIAAASQDLKAVRSATAPADAALGAAAGAPPAPTTAAADPETLYQTAYSDYLRGAYDLALLGFRQYLDSYPETDLADNAVYWIGECYYRQQRYREAIVEYDRVLANWPRSDKTASAMLKRGYAQIESGDRADGIAGLQRVIQTFPNSDEANLARQKLQSVGVDSRR